MRNTRKTHFTLIELLVVIAIIAMLVAMLLPALRTAREKGKSISCLGNERQQSFAWQSYLCDNGGWFPYYWNWITTPSNVFWYSSFSSYEGDKKGNIWKCPSHDYPNWYKNYSTLSYGYNFGCYVRDTNLPRTAGTINIANLKEPSRDILMCDSKRESDNWSCVVQPPGHIMNYLSTRHLNGMNLLWTDGHASWASYREMRTCNPGTYNNPPPGWYGCQPWFRDPININNY